MSYWAGVAAAAAAGTIVGGLFVRIAANKEIEEAREQLRVTQRFIDNHRCVDNLPTQTEGELIDPDTLGEETKFDLMTHDGKVIMEHKTSAPPEETLEQVRLRASLSDVPVQPTAEDINQAEADPNAGNRYSKALELDETKTEIFVDGGINDYGVSYLEQEDYEDEDGRPKYRIDLIMDNSDAIFLMDGEQIHDWDQRLGDSILVDFYKHVPPGTDGILYVRNHRTDEDYEVVRVTP